MALRFAATVLCVHVQDNLLSAHLSNGASSLCGGGSASVSICNSTVSSPIHSSRVSQQLALAFTSHPSPLHSEGRLVQPPRVAGSVATPPVAVVPNQSPVPGVGSLVGSDWCPTVNATSSTPLLHAMTPSSASSASAPFALTPASAASSYLSSPPPSTTSAQHSPVLHSGRPPTAARPPLAVTAAPALTALPARPLLPAAPMSDPSPARDLRVSRTPPPLPAGSLLSRGISSGSSHKFDLSGLSVLIVDDMSLNRKVLRKMLDGVRDVDVACDGVQAVEMVRRRMEAALKITMPPMDMEAIAREHAAGDGAHAAHPEPNYDASSAATIAGTPGSVTGGDTPLSPPQFPLQHTHAVDATVSALLSPTSNGDGSQATGRSLLAHPLHLGPSLPFVLPAAQETHSGLGRHNSFPSMPSQPPPSASLRAGPSPSLHSSARTPDPIGLLSPVSPGTPLVMPRTPLLDSSSAVSFMQQQQHLSAVAANPPSPHSNGSIGRRHTLPSSMLRPLYPHSTNSHPLASAVSAVSTLPASLPPLKCQYDVLITDLSMPRCSGLQEASLIRDLEWQYGLPPVPIIAVTSNTLLTDRIACAKRDINWSSTHEQCMHHACDTVRLLTCASACWCVSRCVRCRFLSKPFSRKDIVSVLELIVHERSLQANSLAPLKRAMHMQMMHATGDSTVAAPPSSCVESCSTESALVRRASACSTAVSADLLVPAHSADSAALAASDSTLFLSMLLPAPALTMGHSAQREISMRDNPQTQQTQQRLAPAIPSPSSVASVPLALASPWLVPSSSLGCSGGSSSSNSSSLISVVSCVSPSPSSPPLTASAPAPQLMCHPSPAALLDDADSSSDSPLLPPVAAAHQAQQRSARPGDSDRLTAIGSSAFTCLSHRHSSSSPAGGCSSDE